MPFGEKLRQRRDELGLTQEDVGANISSELSRQAVSKWETRALFPDSSLGKLYDPLTMPPELVKAHNNLDRAVMAAYGMKGMKSETEIVSLLMERYQQLVSRNQEE